MSCDEPEPKVLMPQAVSIPTELHQSVPGSTRLYWAGPGHGRPCCTRLFQAVPKHATLCQAVPGCALQAAVAVGDIRWQIEGCPWLISSRWPCLPSGAWAGTAAPFPPPPRLPVGVYGEGWQPGGAWLGLRPQLGPRIQGGVGDGCAQGCTILSSTGE